MGLQFHAVCVAAPSPVRCQAYIHKARVHVFNEAATESKVEVDPETIKDVPGAISVRAADLLRTHRHLHVD